MPKRDPCLAAYDSPSDRRRADATGAWQGPLPRGDDAWLSGSPALRLTERFRRAPWRARRWTGTRTMHEQFAANLWQNRGEKNSWQPPLQAAEKAGKKEGLRSGRYGV